MVPVDMHTHSTYSDGIYSPTELVRKATLASVEVLALTDHDTIDGHEEGRDASIREGIHFIPGIELTSCCAGESVHLLGYFKRDTVVSQEFRRRLDQFNLNRRDRAYRMVELLERYFSIYLDAEKLIKETNGTVARPHLARAICSCGYAESFDEAFSTYLGPESPAYIHSSKMSISEGLSLLRGEGCFISLAHPVLLKRSTVSAILSYGGSLGFDAIEARYPGQTTLQTERLTELAKGLRLSITVGSDYHGMEDDTTHGELGQSHLSMSEWNRLSRQI